MRAIRENAAFIVSPQSEPAQRPLLVAHFTFQTRTSAKAYDSESNKLIKITQKQLNASPPKFRVNLQNYIMTPDAPRQVTPSIRLAIPILSSLPSAQPDFAEIAAKHARLSHITEIKSELDHIIYSEHITKNETKLTLWTPLQMNNPKISGEVTQSPIVLIIEICPERALRGVHLSLHYNRISLHHNETPFSLLFTYYVSHYLYSFTIYSSFSPISRLP